MCKKFLVLTKICRSRTDGPALVSDTGDNHLCAISQKILQPSITKITGTLKFNYRVTKISLESPSGQWVKE